MNSSSTLPAEMQRCIDACVRCHEVCLHAATTDCLQWGGAHASPAHITLMLDCALICQLAADFMLRNSPRHRDLCGLCAELCDDCSDECAGLGKMDECVEICRECAVVCEEMAGEREI